MKKLLACMGLMLALSATGCTLYFGDDGDDSNYYSYCDATGCWTCDSNTGACWSDGGGTGCSTDYDCAAGCYCDQGSGTCVETGFCSADDPASQCPDGYTCDDRGSCVPSDQNYCWNTGCPDGEYCDQWSGACTPSTTCGTDADCGAGWWCNAGTCNPLGCTDDTQCAAGCYCDPSTGGCIETGYCSTDADCPSGETCDEARSTCVPSDDPPPPPPPPACDTLTDEASCLARSDCHEILGGVNCTPQCSIDPTDPACSCESYYFAACAAN
jgi:Cys-rich repeat protein